MVSVYGVYNNRDAECSWKYMYALSSDALVTPDSSPPPQYPFYPSCTTLLISCHPADSRKTHALFPARLLFRRTSVSDCHELPQGQSWWNICLSTLWSPLLAMGCRWNSVSGKWDLDSASAPETTRQHHTQQELCGCAAEDTASHSSAFVKWDGSQTPWLCPRQIAAKYLQSWKISQMFNHRHLKIERDARQNPVSKHCLLGTWTDDPVPHHQPVMLLFAFCLENEGDARAHRLLWQNTCSLPPYPLSF